MSDHPLRRLFQRITGRGDAAAMRESLEEVIEESERESPALSAQERVMLGNLLRFGELKVGDVMVPRAEIVAVDETIGLTDLMQLFREAQHSRLPVFRETLDDPTGLIHVKDVLGLLEGNAEGAYCLSPHARIGALLRPILFAPPSMRALDLLLKMQASHTHLALVIDEYGGTDGLVSIEDIIEEIVGDIADEHDEDAAVLKPDGNGFIADARMDLDDFKAQTGHDLLVDGGEEDIEDIDSLGGLVVWLLGRLPQRGEIVNHPDGTEFLVLEADPRRVRRLRVTLPASRATE
ncbi:MAG TPA: hemolysin family protein [Rhizomicrobium sp.]|nr:hemolysin family protein [Rhizomicrobium sp.]HKY17299.1 hemolysin family protein [Rhizomicrobium sp.]